MGGARRVSGFDTRKVSAISLWVPSLATEMFELPRCREADQRISGKLESCSNVYCKLNIMQEELVKGEGGGRAFGFYKS